MKKRMSYRRLRRRYGHAFAADMKALGARIHAMAQKHPVATAGVVGASTATIAGGLTPAMAAAVGGAAGVAASELSKASKRAKVEE